MIENLGRFMKKILYLLLIFICSYSTYAADSHTFFVSILMTILKI
ncbi:MAG: hypothetical protein Rsou_1119 [Candidatus Ruthia sp. Asou_11_S2]|nr:hypothetical protein [Candidatus Ruthia sp. Asou_11_S2]